MKHRQIFTSCPAKSPHPQRTACLKTESHKKALQNEDTAQEQFVTEPQNLGMQLASISQQTPWARGVLELMYLPRSPRNKQWLGDSSIRPTTWPLAADNLKQRQETGLKFVSLNTAQFPRLHNSDPLS